MTASSQPTAWPNGELPQPADDPNLTRTFAGYRAVLASMSLPELMNQANQLAAALELESRQLLNNLISQRLSESVSTIDRLQVRSPRTALPGPDSPDRGAARSQPYQPPPPSAVDLLAASKKLAPRIAAKLVLAEAQRARTDR